MVVGLQWIPNKKNKSVVVWVGNHPLLVLLQSWPTPKWREETNYIEMVIHTILLCWRGTDSQMMQASYVFITVYQASRVASDLLIFLLRQNNVRSSDSNKFASHQNKPWRKAVTRLCRKPRPRGQKLIVHGAVWATRQLWYGFGTWNCWQNWKP